MRTRALLMESALEIFGEKNFTDASVAEISTRAGLSKGAFYWHFRNKQDILLKIVEECCAESTEKIHGKTPKSIVSPRGYFKEMIDRLRYDVRYQKIRKLMIRRHEWPEEVRRRVFEIMQASMTDEIKLLQEYIERRQKEGAIKDTVSARGAAVLLTGISRGVGTMELSGLLPEGFVESLDILFEALDKEFYTTGQDVQAR